MPDYELAEFEGTDTKIIEAGDDGAILDEDSDDVDERPEDCECSGSALEVEYDLPCWPCYREGFETPNPAAAEGE